MFVSGEGRRGTRKAMAVGIPHGPLDRVYLFNNSFNVLLLIRLDLLHAIIVPADIFPAREVFGMPCFVVGDLHGVEFSVPWNSFERTRS
jgi:hypothetical protein